MEKSPLERGDAEGRGEDRRLFDENVRVTRVGKDQSSHPSFGLSHPGKAVHMRTLRSLRSTRAAGNTRAPSCGDAGTRKAGNTGARRKCRATAWVKPFSAQVQATARARSALNKIGFRRKPYPSRNPQSLIE